MNSEQIQSHIRTALKAAGTLLVAFGVTDESTTGPALSAIADGVGGGLFLWGAIWSHFHHGA